jgi:glycosyltransferase involved in cell wall biosynthesis
MHTFSIIIPHYEIPKLLQRCLDSIPDVPEVQVIVVDDNSSEQKVDFEHFPGLNRKNTLCIFDKKGGGAGHARNVGLKHADGKWLVFSDADDFFTKDAFQILDGHKNDPYDIILFKADSMDSDTYAPSDRHLQHDEAIDKAQMGSITAKEAVLTMPVPWCKMFRRDYIQRKGILFDEVFAANDVMFVTKATCWTNDEAVTTSSEVLYVITTRQNSLFDGYRKDPKNYLCRLEVQMRRNKFIDKYPYPKRPIIVQVLRALKFGPKTFCKAFALGIKHRALFSGTSSIFKKLFTTIS